MKKIRLKLIIVILVLVFFVSCAPADYSASYGPFKYSVKAKEKIVSIEGYYGSEPFVEIPAYIEGMPVVSINRFTPRYGADAYNVVSVKIPDTVKYINHGFGFCKKLATVEFGKNVEYIGDGAFEYCTSLAVLDLPESLLKIDNYAFSGCENLVAVSLKHNIYSIGESAFSGCTALKSIEIPDSVVEIGESAFSFCKNLRTIRLSNNLISLENNLFDSSGILYLEIPHSVIFIKSYAVPHVSEIIIPNSVIQVQKNGMYGVNNIYIERGTNMEAWHPDWTGGWHPNIIYDYDIPIE